MATGVQGASLGAWARSTEENVMKLQTRLTLLMTALLLSALVAWAKVTTDYDHRANFARFKTYSWARVKTPDSLWDDRVKAAVDGQLAAKGWSQVPSGGDVLVSARGATRDQQELNTYYDGFGRRRFGGFGSATTTVDVYKVGTLIVDVFDGTTRNLLWQGVATDTLSDKAEKNIKRLDKSVEKMFKHFPPGSERG
jgi:Domain of unknown function (DUF4136)